MLKDLKVLKSLINWLGARGSGCPQVQLDDYGRSILSPLMPASMGFAVASL